MKATLKSVAVALALLAVVVATLTIIDGNSVKTSTANKTYIRVEVVDLDGLPVHNAQVTVNGNTFYTDNKGLSPAIELASIDNCYDSTITDWGTVTVLAQKTGFSPAVALNCVVYSGQTRKLTIKAYPKDGSDLPYVVYVESPPDDYVNNLIHGQ